MSSLGNRGADKQLSKDFARNREQGTYQSTGNGNKKASNNFCVFWILGSSIFIGYKKKICIPTTTNTQRFQQSGPKRTKKLLYCDLNV